MRPELIHDSAEVNAQIALTKIAAHEKQCEERYGHLVCTLAKVERGMENILNKLDTAIAKTNTRIDDAISDSTRYQHDMRNEIHAATGAAKAAPGKAEATWMRWVIGGMGAVIVILLGAVLS